MAEDQGDDSQKTEEPTPKKLEETRQKGQVPLSREMNNWIMLLAGTIVVVAMGGAMMGSLADTMKLIFENSYQLTGLGTAIREIFWDVMKALSLPILFLLLAAFAGPFVQIGPLFAPEGIKPSLSKNFTSRRIWTLVFHAIVIRIFQRVA